MKTEPIKARQVRVDFEPVPKHWFAGLPAATHLSNAVNLLFPAGERFFIRSVRHYLDRIDDPELIAEVRGFFGQEGSHAREHERFFETLEAQGYEVREFLTAFEHSTFEVLSKYVPPVLQLSATVACEHFTAALADNALRSEVFDHVHPRMRELLLWHAAEEIEHKAVAFQVLKRVNPSYLVRMAGLALALVTLVYWWLRGYRMLLRQDGMTLRDAAKAARNSELLQRHRRPAEVIRAAVLEYLRPGFHPWDHDNSELARNHLKSMPQAA